MWEANRASTESHGLLGAHSIYLDKVPLSALPSPAFQGLRYLRLGRLSGELDLSLEELLDVLRANPDLHYFKLSASLPDAPPELDTLPVELKNLKTLHFDYLRAWVSRWLLKRLVLRSDGTTLVLSGHYPDDSRIGVGMQALSNRSITALCFVSPSYWSAKLDIDALLAELPGLKSLALQEMTFYVPKHTGSARTQYPVMPSLSIDSCDVNSPELFVDMVVRHSVGRMRVSRSGRDLTKKLILDRLPGIEFSEEPGSSVPPTWRPFGR
ncbi:hypothetical protein BDV93DRAFT_560305 [Ceratobasidium sp. AG-I]|nr:hypothetical protein BDV93DRAFT_560305 [Ceratobasidium sp. AG-I]